MEPDRHLPDMDRADAERLLAALRRRRAAAIDAAEVDQIPRFDAKIAEIEAALRDAPERSWWSRQSRGLRFLMIGAAAAVWLYAFALSGTPAETAVPRAAPYVAPALPPAPEPVVLSVTGTAGAVMVSYTNGTGGIEQDVVGLPWSLAVPAGGIYSVSAQNQGTTGTVEVSISGSGVTPASGSTSAPYGVATAASSGL